MSEIVAKYHGVNVIKSCGRYYPEVDGLDLDISSETYNMCPLNWVDEMEVMGDLYTNMELLNLN